MTVVIASKNEYTGSVTPSALNDVIVKAIAKSLADTSKLKDVIQRIIKCTYV